MSALSDAELIDRWRLGDSRAMAMLVQRYHAALVRRYGADAAQDTWLRVVTYSGLTARGSLWSLLCRIAEGKLANERARRAVYVAAEPTLQLFGGPVPGAWSRPRRAPTAAPQKRVAPPWPACRWCPRPAASRRSGLCDRHRRQVAAGEEPRELRPYHRRQTPMRK